MQHEKAVNIKKALQYNCQYHCIIATGDGSKRSTKKSDLLPVIWDKMINENITIIPANIHAGKGVLKMS